MEDKYISVKEAADIMGYSRMHVVRLIQSGEIKAEKIGRSYAVLKSSIPGIFKDMTKDEKKDVDKAVNMVIKEYGEALKKLSEE